VQLSELGGQLLPLPPPGYAPELKGSTLLGTVGGPLANTQKKVEK